MSNTYTSTIEVSVWKEHACITCGTKFRYLFNRTKQGQGATPDAANNNAHQAVIKALEKKWICNHAPDAECTNRT
jgi:hypothetical protein